MRVTLLVADVGMFTAVLHAGRWVLSIVTQCVPDHLRPCNVNYHPSGALACNGVFATNRSVSSATCCARHSLLVWDFVHFNAPAPFCTSCRMKCLWRRDGRPGRKFSPEGTASFFPTECSLLQAPGLHHEQRTALCRT
jgi:hypothetical protein